MRAVLMSIQPKWCELIASGKKTIEVRKTKPKLETPFKVYIYCTKGKFALLRKNNEYRYDHWEFAEFHKSCGNEILNSKVIGEFVCDTFVIDKTFGHDPLFYAASCMNDAEIAAYCTNKEIYGWHISNLVIYDKPRELSEFRKYGVCPCSAKSILHCTENMSFCAKRNLTRPPQSWCYVEEVGEV